MKDYLLKVVHRKRNENHSFDIQISSTPEEFERLAMSALDAANLLYTAKLERSLRS